MVKLFKMFDIKIYIYLYSPHLIGATLKDSVVFSN